MEKPTLDPGLPGRTSQNARPFRDREPPCRGGLQVPAKTCPPIPGPIEPAIAHTRDNLGRWSGGNLWTTKRPEELAEALAGVAQPLFLLDVDGRLALGEGGSVDVSDTAVETEHADPRPRVIGIVPPCDPRNLGDRQFCRDLGLRYPYIAGAMANGIASAELVEAMARGGMLGVFGAAGLKPSTVAENLSRIAASLGSTPWATNLIHTPLEQGLEDAIVDLYLERDVRIVSASAYLDLTLPVVRYRVAGIHTDPEGRVITPNHVLGKVSRVEVARKFLAPPPTQMLAELVGRGDITEAQAAMASTIPVAQDLTVEADSGGHTDNRPAIAILPTMLALRDRMQTTHNYDRRLRIGAAGGIATPHSAAAAFAMGAAYVVTGSINQACREAGTSDNVRRLLAEVEQADVKMAPAADMFEMGIKLQVTNRQTMFPMRAQKLHDLYTAYENLDDLPVAERQRLERTILGATIPDVWRDTEAFWRDRDPRQLERAAQDPHHKMALVFRWYLGQSSRWANSGVDERKLDYQVWCGPAMGAFNEWVRGTWLENWENRRVVTVGLNILQGAAVLTRVFALRSQGIDVPAEAIDIAPRESSELEAIVT